MDTASVIRRVDEMQAIKASIMEETDCDDTIRDTLEGMTNLNEIITALLIHESADMALLSGLDEIMDQWRARKERVKTRIDRKRALMQQALAIAGQKSVETPIGTVSTRRVPASLVVMNEDKIPSRWFTSVPKLQRGELTKALRKGENIPGVTMSNGGETISIKRG